MSDPEPSWPLWVDLPPSPHARGRATAHPAPGKADPHGLRSARLGQRIALPARWGASGRPALSTGDMLRAAVAAGTEIGLRAKEAMQAARAVVVDDLVVAVVVDRLAEPDCENGCVLDGFPRTQRRRSPCPDALAAGAPKGHQGDRAGRSRPRADRARLRPVGPREIGQVLPRGLRQAREPRGASRRRGGGPRRCATTRRASVARDARTTRRRRWRRVSRRTTRSPRPSSRTTTAPGASRAWTGQPPEQVWAAIEDALA